MLRHLVKGVVLFCSVPRPWHVELSAAQLCCCQLKGSLDTRQSFSLCLLIVKYNLPRLLPSQSWCRADSRDAWQHQSAGVSFLWRGGHDDSSLTKKTEGQEGHPLQQMRLPGYSLPDHVV